MKSTKVLVDANHGQGNWAQTGFSSRQLDTTLAGIARLLGHRGYDCVSNTEPLTLANIRGAAAVVIPPPTGNLDLATSMWLHSPQTLLSGEELRSLLSYLEGGGRLIVFSYRWGDAFTKANVGQLFASLGWCQNDDAVIDLGSVGTAHPLHTTFKTGVAEFRQSWASQGLAAVVWRPVTSFDLLPKGTGFPIVQSPESCIRLRLVDHTISHTTATICAGGYFGAGRYLLLGGPHAFEETSFGFLSRPDNTRLIENLFSWLFSDQPPAEERESRSEDSPKAVIEGSSCISELKALWDLACIQSANNEKGSSFADFVQRFLLASEILRLLSRSSWSLDREAELDLVFECISPKPLWSASRGLIPVECKNWSAGIGSPEISRFADKIERTSGKIGLFAARRFSGPAWAAVSKARLLHSTVVGLLDDADFASCLEGNASAISVIEGSIIRSILA